LVYSVLLFWIVAFQLLQMQKVTFYLGKEEMGRRQKEGEEETKVSILKM